MDRKQIINDVRAEGLLKGLKPCYITLTNNGNIIKNKNRSYIMSLRDNKLYFQRISNFLHVLKPQDDFIIDVKQFKEYDIGHFKNYNTFYLFAEEQGVFLEMLYAVNTYDCMLTRDNILRIAKELEKMGIPKRVFKDVEEDFTEESNNEENINEEVSDDKEDDRARKEESDKEV